MEICFKVNYLFESAVYYTVAAAGGIFVGDYVIFILDPEPEASFGVGIIRRSSSPQIFCFVILRSYSH